MHETSRARLVAYAVAVAAPAVTLLVRWPLEAVLGDRVLYMPFFGAVLLAAYFGGFWPGLLATVISALAATYFLVEPLFSLEITNVYDAVAVTFFVLISTVISGLSESRLRSQRRIAASERGYAVTLASIGDAVIATDTQARVTFLNPAAEVLTGWPLADAVGRPLGEVFRIINEQTQQPAEDPAAKVLRPGTVVGLANHTALLARDGRQVPIDDCGAPIIDDRGVMAGVVLVFRDVTQRRQAEAAAETANQAKNEFLANVSHEIRTPMNAILGMTELALETELTEDQRQCLKTVKSAADNLLSILNDLLDFAKIEAGKLELDPADFGLRAAVGDTLRALVVRAHKKGLELIYHVQPDVPDALVGDVGRLRQVLLNLVGNAIKFTDEGEVVVRVEIDGDSSSPSPRPDEVGLRFTVCDTGIGIPRDQQERIFRAFEQEDTSTTRKYGGTGLGLTIAARLVALMSGKITVDSEPGRGSIFAFTAQFGRQPHPSEQLAGRSPALLHALPVLVVDDNATNRRILEEWLRGWQMKPEAVGDGVAAMDALWHAAARGCPYPLVLLDARMPDTDGPALAAKIRERAELSATRIILLTSGDDPGDWARIRQLRVNAHLLKPVEQNELLEMICRVMSPSSGKALPVASPAGGGEQTQVQVPAARPLRILVAEDNEFNVQLLEQLLGQRGHDVRLANNGREALSLAAAETFDLLLLDVHMPEMDGFQVVQAIRARERTGGGRLPVIALTACSRKEDRERCLAAGMDDFLAKPIQAADLWAAMDRLVGASPPADRPGPGLLDPRVLLAACGCDAAILEKIGQAFRARLPDQLKAIQDALRDRNALRLREAAHKLAGMVAAFSTVAGGVASELEDQAAQGQLEAARALVDQLETMAPELFDLVSQLSLDALRDQARGEL